MSIGWKAFNVFVVMIPKLVLWYLTMLAGIIFLMETSEIDDVIVNSVTLNFLVHLDEMIFESLASSSANHLLDICKDIPACELTSFPDQDDDVIDAYLQTPTFGSRALHVFQGLVPPRLVLACTLTCIFVGHYYWRHCEWHAGKLVSRPLYFPASVSYNFFNFIFPSWAPLLTEGEQYWTPHMMHESQH